MPARFPIVPAAEFFPGLRSHDLSKQVCEHSLAKRRQPYQVVLGDGLQGLSGLAPGGETADDDERIEAFFPQ
jgi:hypothetical protein